MAWHTHTLALPWPVLENTQSLAPAGSPAKCRVAGPNPRLCPRPCPWPGVGRARVPGARAVTRSRGAASAPSLVPRSGSQTDGQNGDAKLNRSWRPVVQVAMAGQRGLDAQGGVWGPEAALGGRVAEHGVECWDTRVGFPTPEPRWELGRDTAAGCAPSPPQHQGWGCTRCPRQGAALSTSHPAGSWCDWILPHGVAVADFHPCSATAASSAQVGDAQRSLPALQPPPKVMGTPAGSGHPPEPVCPLSGCSKLSGCSPKG